MLPLDVKHCYVYVSRWLIKHLGGFFIKRKLDTTAGKDVLYRKCLHEVRGGVVGEGKGGVVGEGRCGGRGKGRRCGGEGRGEVWWERRGREVWWERRGRNWCTLSWKADLASM